MAEFQSFLCWIIIYHLESYRPLVNPNLMPVSILLMLDNNLSPFIIVHSQLTLFMVSILLMLDNNLSHLWERMDSNAVIMFQSFLCWIIIYHSMYKNCDNSRTRVSILLMLDNNLSLWPSNTLFTGAIFVSILLMLDNNLSPRAERKTTTF